MTTYQDIITNVWLKGSDVSQGSPIIAPILQSPGYVYPLFDNFPLLGADPAVKLEPVGGNQNTETTRFTRYILLIGRPTTTTLSISIAVQGIAHIYERTGTVSDTGYWYMYMKLVKTKDFATFTDVSGEIQILQYTETIPTNADVWKDTGSIVGRITTQVTLNAGEYLLLAVRGSSRNSGGVATTSIGINSTNFKVYPTIFI